MLTLEQTTKLQNRHLEIVINQKGYRLDPEIQAEMNYWRDILIREVAENQTLRSNLKRITDSRDLIREQLEKENKLLETIKKFYIWRISEN